MQFFPASLFVKCISNIHKHYRLFSIIPFGKWGTGLRIKTRDRQGFAFYKEFETMCVQLELTAAAASLRKMLDCLSDPNGRYGQFFNLGVKFADRFIDEMQNRYIFALSLREAEIAKDPMGGWENAVKQFPSAAYDIEESSLCLAMQRSTSSVFHSIRGLEAAIGGLSKCLGISNPTRAADRNWGTLLKAIKDELERRWPTSASRLSGWQIL
jgi:hypothetical protein